MLDDLMLIESAGMVDSIKPRWDVESDYWRVSLAVDLIKKSGDRMLRSKSCRQDAGRRYGDYIRGPYLETRRALAASGWKYGSEYPDWVNPYYIWRDCHAVISWEYLRRSRDYRTYFSRYMRFLDSKIPEIAAHFEGECQKSTRTYGVYEDFLKTCRGGADHDKAWKKLCLNMNYRKYNINCHNEPSDLPSFVSAIFSSEDRMYEIFNVMPNFGVPDPGCDIPPIFLRYSRPIKVVGTKFMFGKEIICLEDRVFSPFDSGVIIAFRLDNNIDEQICEAKSAIERLCKNHQISPERSVENRKRPRIEKHVEYIRLLDARDCGVTSPSVIAEKLLKHRDNVGFSKRVEKEIGAADGISLNGYFELATLPYRG